MNNIYTLLKKNVFPSWVVMVFLTIVASLAVLSLTFSSTQAATTYKLTATVYVGEGVIAKSPNVTDYPEGTEVTLTATSNSNDSSAYFAWEIRNAAYDPNPIIVEAQNPIKITMNSDKWVYLYIRSSFEINSKAGEGGTIYPFGSFQAIKGANQQFDIQPIDDEYKIDNVYVDGISQGPINTYIFNNVVADHEIDAIFAKKALSLRVNLFANPNYGEPPLDNIDLTATVSGTATGNTSYTFYCNRSDSGTDITAPFDAQYLNIAEQHVTVPDICDYAQKGSYMAKVIIEREGIKSEARTSIYVGENPPQDPRDTPIDPNDWVKVGKDNTKKSYVEHQLELPLELNWKSIPMPEHSAMQGQSLEMLSSENILLAKGSYGYSYPPFYFFDAFTGEKIRESYLGNMSNRRITGPGVIYDGKYYNKLYDTGFYAMDINTGVTRNGFYGPVEGGNAYGVYNESVIAKFYNQISALDIYTGSGIWATSPLQEISAAFYKGIMLARRLGTAVSAYLGYPSAFDASTGEKIWSNTVNSFYASSIVDNGMVYTEDNQNFYALDYSTGKIIWRTGKPLSYFPTNRPSNQLVYKDQKAANNKLVVFSEAFSIYDSMFASRTKILYTAVDKFTGEIKWNYDFIVDDSIEKYLNIFAVSDDYIYSFHKSSSSYVSLSVFDINSGKELQKINIPGVGYNMQFNQMIIANKQLYVFYSEGLNDYIYSYKGQNPAAFAGDDQISAPDSAVNFNASRSFTGPGKSITNYDWNFGDGSSGTGASASHNYSNSGKYAATLTITDSAGKQDTDTLLVDVISPLPHSELTSVSNSGAQMIQTDSNDFFTFYSDISGNLVYSISKDQGASWLSPSQIYENSDLLKAVYTNGDIFVLLYDKLNKKERLIKISRQDSDNWIVALLPDIPSPTYMQEGSLMADSQGRLWHSYVGLNPQDKYYKNIFFSFSDNNGKDWSAPEPITPNTYYTGALFFKPFLWNDKPSFIKFENNFYRYILFYRNDSGIWQQGSYFQLFPLPSHYSCADFTFDIAVTGDNVIHIVYYGGDALKYIKKDSTLQGAWSASVNIGKKQDKSPKLITDGTKLWLYWQEYYKRIRTDWFYNLVISEYSSESGWGAPQKIANASKNLNFNFSSISNLQASTEKLPFIWLEGKSVPYNMLYKNIKISGAILPNAFTIAVSAGDNGSITPSGEVKVNEGASQSFSITPNSGYHIADVLADGISIGAVATHTFNNVLANHAISATFAKDDVVESPIPTPTPTPTPVATTYTIIPSATAGGNISPSTNVLVEEGSNQSFTITPDSGYHILDVKVDDKSEGAIGSYEFKNVKEAHSISASFEKDITFYTLTLASQNGAVSKTPDSSTYAQSAEVTLEANPDSGYHFVNWTGDAQSADNPIKVVMDSNKNIVANFERNDLSVSLSSNPTSGEAPLKDVSLSAVVSGSASGTVNYTFYCDRDDSGTNITTGYVVKQDNKSETTFTADKVCNYSNPGIYSAKVIVERGGLSAQARATITVSAIKTHAITASAGTHGSITPTGEVSVNEGSNQSFTITPDSGYHILDVKVDDKSEGAIGSYEFKNVKEAHSISASFEKDITFYTLTLASQNGAVSKTPDSSTYAQSAEVNLQANPDSGYHFVNWTGDAQSADNPIKVVMDSNKNIAANFERDDLSVSLSSNPTSGEAPLKDVSLSAVVSGSASGTVNYTFYCDRDDSGTNITTGYVVKQDNKSETTFTADKVCNYSNPGIYSAKVIVERGGLSAQARATITVSAIKTHAITASAGTHGSITPTGEVSVNEGSNQSFTITPDSGYHILDVKVDDKSEGAIGSYEFKNVKEAHSISASFEKDDVVESPVPTLVPSPSPANDCNDLTDLKKYKPQSSKLDLTYDENKIDNLADFLIKKTNTAEIFFLETLNLIHTDKDGCYQPINIDTAATISPSKVKIDSTSYPELNRKARIKFYNITASHPQIMKDGVLCKAPDCEIISYDQATHILIVEVKGF